MFDDTEVKQAVRQRYAGHATSGSSCCGDAPTSCGCAGGPVVDARQLDAALGYDPGEMAQIPEDANLGLGCGNPLALLQLQPGETVVDLGSGGGIDCFLAAKRVGPTGRVIGVDMTPEMIDRARRNAQRPGSTTSSSAWARSSTFPSRTRPRTRSSATA